MKKSTRNSLVIIVVLVVILGLGFGVYRIFFIPRPLKMRKLESMYIVHPRSNHKSGWGLHIVDREYDDPLGSVYDNGNVYQKGLHYAQSRDIFLRISKFDQNLFAIVEIFNSGRRSVP